MRAALALLVCAACGQTRVSQLPAHASIDGAPIDFGQTPVRFPVERSVLVINVGRVPLHVELAGVTGTGFAAAQAPIDVAPADSLSVKVVFTPPDSGPFTGSLTLTTNDTTQPSVTIALSGVGTLPGSIRVTPSSLDFGRVGEGQTATREVVVESLGPGDLYLAALGATPDAFAWIGSLKTPAGLAAGARLTLGVRFSPTPDTVSSIGAFTVDSSDGAQPRVTIPASASINHAPIAVAQGSVESGAPQTGLVEADVGAVVNLDGTASSDPDGDTPLTFQWTLDARPAGSTAAIAQPTAAQTQLRLDAAGVYSVLLTAIDAAGLPSFQPARLDIRATPAEHLVVELIWDKTAPDLDLHVLQGGAQLQSSQDCYWANPSPAWFPGGADYNPQHGGDQLVGYGPELVMWKQPAPGTYPVVVVYKADHGATDPSTTAQVRIYAEGVLVASLSHLFTKAGQTWTAGGVQWPGGGVVGTSP